MGKLLGFLEYNRIKEKNKPVAERLQDYKEFTKPLGVEKLQEQGARCMGCGIPFCHSGCPLGNLIPDFNDALYNKRWKEALKILHSTNNFPEFTGRLCPAPCESACVLGIIEEPVSIELIEKYIVEEGFKNGWITPEQPTHRTGRKIAVIGSGPAGLATAQQLNRAGHTVTVLERDAKPGGLLRYGIPNFKLDKDIIDRRLDILEQEGIIFENNVHVGKDYSIDHLDDFDAVVITAGSTKRRGLDIAGADLKGVVQAMDFLKHQNQLIEGTVKEQNPDWSAKDKNVIVIGGGDTGSDCIGTSNRHGAKSVTNFEIMSQPPEHRGKENPWPYWPFTLKISSSHEEGVTREYAILTKEFVGDGKGNLKALKTVEVEWKKEENNPPKLIEIAGTEKEFPCDLVLLALGFVSPEESLPEQLGLTLDGRGNIKSDDKYCTNKSNIFVAGDARRGQSLIVWAISEGRQVAKHVDEYLMRITSLPYKEKGDLPKA